MERTGRAPKALGKKIDTLKIVGKLRTWEIDLRLDAKRSMFLAEVSGLVLENTDVRRLTDAVEERVRQLDEVTFSPVICVAYQIRRREGSTITEAWGERHAHVDVESCTGLDLRFEAFELSDQSDVERRDGYEYAYKLYRKLDVAEDGTLTPHVGAEPHYVAGRRKTREERIAYERILWSESDDRKIVPFTVHRWQILVEVQKRMREIAARLDSVLNAEPERMAVLLDAATGTKLLGDGR